ncbi:MAG: hypothetical protein ACLFPS_09720 [Clostridia bacterium]
MGKELEKKQKKKQARENKMNNFVNKRQELKAFVDGKDIEKMNTKELAKGFRLILEMLNIK